MPRIELRGVEYEVNGEVVIRETSLELSGPGLVQLIGPNGAGKTTLLRITAGLVKPGKGRVLIDGEDVTGNPARAGRHLGYVPQRPPVSRFNPMTVWEFVASRALFQERWPRLREGGVRGVVEWVLERVGLPRDAWFKRLQELSGGQLMRAFIARTLVHDPGILLLDEPFSPVDPPGRVGLVGLLVELSARRLVVVTSHDPMLLLKYTRTLVLVNRGVVAAGPPSRVLRKDLLVEVYGGAVLEVERHLHISDSHAG